MIFQKLTFALELLGLKNAGSGVTNYLIMPMMPPVMTGTPPRMPGPTEEAWTRAPSGSCAAD